MKTYKRVYKTFKLENMPNPNEAKNIMLPIAIITTFEVIPDFLAFMGIYFPPFLLRNSPKDIINTVINTTPNRTNRNTIITMAIDSQYLPDSGLNVVSLSYVNINTFNRENDLFSSEFLKLMMLSKYLLSFAVNV